MRFAETRRLVLGYRASIATAGLAVPEAAEYTHPPGLRPSGSSWRASSRGRRLDGRRGRTPWARCPTRTQQLHQALPRGVGLGDTQASGYADALFPIPGGAGRRNAGRGRRRGSSASLGDRRVLEGVTIRALASPRAQPLRAPPSRLSATGRVIP